MLLTDLKATCTGWLAFTDVFLALLPISIIYALNIPTRKKIGLCTILGLGIL